MHVEVGDGWIERAGAWAVHVRVAADVEKEIVSRSLIFQLQMILLLVVRKIVRIIFHRLLISSNSCVRVN